MTKTRNDRPRTSSARPSQSSDKENKAPRTVAAPGRPSGQHSPLVREATAKNFLAKTEQSIQKGQQSADTLLKDPIGFEKLKHNLLSAGLVLAHNPDKNTVSAISAKKFFKPEAAAEGQSPPTQFVLEELKKNTNFVEDELGDILADAIENGHTFEEKDFEIARNANVLMSAFFVHSDQYFSALATNPELLDIFIEAAVHIGVSLVYVPNRDAPMALTRRREDADK